LYTIFPHAKFLLEESRFSTQEFDPVHPELLAITDECDGPIDITAVNETLQS